MKYIVVILLAAVLMAGMGFFLFQNDLQKDLQALNFEDVDLMDASDGTYTAAADLGPITVEVEVTVEDNRIQQVKLLKHKHGMGDPAEILPFIMVTENTWDVDCATGATISSQAIIYYIINMRWIL